jgi:protein-disulfide isomerase
MRKSSIFLAVTVLIGTGVLIIFAISSLPPIVADVQNDNSDMLTAAPLEAPTVVYGNPTIGPADAVVIIVEFGDFQCQPCATMNDTLKQIVKDYPQDVRIVWKDFPNLSIHKEALDAAMAARCAGVQGAFWEYHDMLYANQNSINTSAYDIFAQQLELEPNDFSSCMKGEITRPIVERDFEEGQRLRIDATPYLFVNKRRVSGAVEYSFLHDLIASEIASAPAKPPAGQNINAAP